MTIPRIQLRLRQAAAISRALTREVTYAINVSVDALRTDPLTVAYYTLQGACFGALLGEIGGNFHGMFAMPECYRYNKYQLVYKDSRCWEDGVRFLHPYTCLNHSAVDWEYTKTAFTKTMAEGSTMGAYGFSGMFYGAAIGAIKGFCEGLMDVDDNPKRPPLSIGQSKIMQLIWRGVAQDPDPYFLIAIIYSLSSVISGFMGYVDRDVSYCQSVMQAANQYPDCNVKLGSLIWHCDISCPDTSVIDQLAQQKGDLRYYVGSRLLINWSVLALAGVNHGLFKGMQALMEEQNKKNPKKENEDRKIVKIR